MKNPPPSAPARPNSRFWPTLAIASVCANAVLLALVAVQSTRAKARPPSAPAATPAASTAVPAASRARPTGPYAALGSYMAENNRIADLGWSQSDFDAFLEGFRASYEGRGLPLDEDAKKLRDDISSKVQAMLAAEQPDPAEEYFRMLREKEGVQQTPSGLHYRVTEKGYGGPKPTAADTVVISFAARTPDGRSLPDLGRSRVRLPVRDLLPGLAEGIQLLSVGGKALVYLPPKLSFSPENWPPEVPPNMPLAYFVELHEIIAPARG